MATAKLGAARVDSSPKVNRNHGTMPVCSLHVSVIVCLAMATMSAVQVVSTLAILGQRRIMVTMMGVMEASVLLQLLPVVVAKEVPSEIGPKAARVAIGTREKVTMVLSSISPQFQREPKMQTNHLVDLSLS
jgi:hypothetical protein